MTVDNTARYPRIHLKPIDGHPRCPKCNFLLRRIEVRVPSSQKYKAMDSKFIWGCLGWHSKLHCHTQYEDNYGYPDFNRELKQCL